MLVVLAAEGDDHPQHRHRLVDDRERAPLQLAGPSAGAARSASRRRRTTSRDSGTMTSESSASSQSISEAMTSIPTRVISDSAIGGMTITIVPSAAAWMLIWLISAPGLVLVVEGQREPLDVVEEVAAQVEDHVLLGLRPEVVVVDREAVADDDDQEAKSSIESSRTTASGLPPKICSMKPPGFVVVEDLVEDHRQRPRLGQAEDRARGPSAHGDEDQRFAIGPQIGLRPRQRLPKLPGPRLVAPAPRPPCRCGRSASGSGPIQGLIAAPPSPPTRGGSRSARSGRWPPIPARRRRRRPPPGLRSRRRPAGSPSPFPRGR